VLVCPEEGLLKDCWLEDVIEISANQKEIFEGSVWVNELDSEADDEGHVGVAKLAKTVAAFS
jgi:hypothetical protein